MHQSTCYDILHNYEIKTAPNNMETRCQHMDVLMYSCQNPVTKPSGLHKHNKNNENCQYEQFFWNQNSKVINFASLFQAFTSSHYLYKAAKMDDIIRDQIRYATSQVKWQDFTLKRSSITLKYLAVKNTDFLILRTINSLIRL